MLKYKQSVSKCLAKVTLVSAPCSAPIGQSAPPCVLSTCFSTMLFSCLRCLDDIYQWPLNSDFPLGYFWSLPSKSHHGVSWHTTTLPQSALPGPAVLAEGTGQWAVVGGQQSAEAGKWQESSQVQEPRHQVTPNLGCFHAQANLAGRPVNAFLVQQP